MTWGQLSPELVSPTALLVAEHLVCSLDPLEPLLALLHLRLRCVFTHFVRVTLEDGSPVLLPDLSLGRVAEHAEREVVVRPRRISAGGVRPSDPEIDAGDAGEVGGQT